MIIFPAIDLKDGKCVRLKKGEFNTSQVVADSPIETALSFYKKGAEYIHMVDLNGALKGSPQNHDIIKNIKKNINIPLQIGGGIRDLNTIELLIKYGIDRVIVGTAALRNTNFVKEAVRNFGDKIAVGIDAKDGYVAVEGWVEISNVNFIEFGKVMEDAGVRTIIFTDVSKDGMLQGPNLESTCKLNETISSNIIASGGITNLDDIKKLKDKNLYGAIVGKALYNGNLDLETAIKVGRGD